MSKKVKPFTPRIGGVPISRQVWNNVVSTLKPDGGPNSSVELKMLCRIDPTVRRQCIDLARTIMAEGLRAGMVLPEARKKKQTFLDRLEPAQQEIYREVIRREDLAREEAQNRPEPATTAVLTVPSPTAPPAPAETLISHPTERKLTEIVEIAQKAAETANNALTAGNPNPALDSFYTPPTEGLAEPGWNPFTDYTARDLGMWTEETGLVSPGQLAAEAQAHEAESARQAAHIRNATVTSSYFKGRR